jgi:general secretion pathway protein I
MSWRSRGFTLLEVLVAIAILGLGLTVILSSQAGLFASVGHGRNVSFAANLVRCKMAEVEVDLAREGYPLIDQLEEGPCCEDESDPVFGCAWQVEQVELPEPPMTSDEDDMLSLFGDDGDESGGPLSALQEMRTNGADALTGDGGLSGIAGLFGDSMSGDQVSGLASYAMRAVYPELKPMLEASIRKVTVTVSWKEGQQARELEVVQYLTNPTQGMMDEEAADLSGMIPGGLGGDTKSNPTSKSPKGSKSPGGSK